MASTEDHATAGEIRKREAQALRDEHALMLRHPDADTGKRRAGEVVAQLKELGEDLKTKDDDDTKGDVETTDAGPGGNTGRGRRS